MGSYKYTQLLQPSILLHLNCLEKLKTASLDSHFLLCVHLSFGTKVGCGINKQYNNMSPHVLL